MQVQTCHIGIVGTGLIGGSIAQALVNSGKTGTVIGWDLDRDALRYAVENKFISSSTETLEELISISDVLILALPIQHLTSIKASVSSKRIKAVLDVASVRNGISEELSQIWGPAHCGFHPMAGLEKGGIEHASSQLVKDATVAIAPDQNTSTEAIVIARDLIRAMGAFPVEMTSEEHDRTVAAISHLPMFLATVLSNVAGEMDDKLPCLPDMSAGGFRDTSRVASGPSWLISSVWSHNEKEIRPLIKKSIDLLERMANSTPEEISSIADSARERRDDILARKIRRKIMNLKNIDVRTIKPAHSINGDIVVPGDKSISHRAGFLGALSTEGIEVTNFSNGADCASTLACMKELGCHVTIEGDTVKVSKGEGIREPDDQLESGNSGTTARLLCGLLAGIPGTFSVISGDESLKKRPMSRIVDPLRTLGARIDGRDGGKRLPLSVRGGRLTGGQYILSTASAQVKTGLLLAGLSAQGSVSVTEPLKTRDHTERMLEHLGVPLRTEDKTVTVYPFNDLPGGSWAIPGDFSSAAFWIVASAILPDSEITISKVGVNPTRTGLLKVLETMGLNFSTTNLHTSGGEPCANLTVKTSNFKGIFLGKEDIPAIVDELPVLAIAATQATGTTEIRGAGELRVKECDRIAAVTEGLKAIGAKVTEHDDGWTIEGGQTLTGGSVVTHGDHRIAMAFAIAGLISQNPVELDNSSCVDISYPGFFDQIESSVTGGKDK